MTEPAAIALTAKQQHLLMASVFFVGILLLLVASAVLGAALLGMVPVETASMGLMPLISGLASVAAAVFLSSS